MFVYKTHTKKKNNKKKHTHKNLSIKAGSDGMQNMRKENNKNKKAKRQNSEIELITIVKLYH